MFFKADGNIILTGFFYASTNSDIDSGQISIKLKKHFFFHIKEKILNLFFFCLEK